MRNGDIKQHGFTMIELLVTLLILGLLVSLAAPRYFGNMDKAKEDVLREDLYVLRDALDKFYSDRSHYPNTLDELVTERYIRKIPVDPFTQSAKSWIPVPAADPSMGVVSDVRSGAPNTARDGTLLKDW
ncbi:prepilin-type N-terminal cleavage/methylation domain-containing protein [Janthinobacterium sp. SUN100]|uniref:prepilin-type N-terminal cleavage/methylation domain-containing protein n=1 Tax=Janthinobacterium sp. SUN100 TaxID=3004101 RepID=UPI0025B211EC|nr:prepilin-type N-terminal cleavage/methylation domain-containing protein [Janthinobacterium sp. SUN100]MDN2700402.1 prepilin-type N-terminal cleavage/methylation domain-containing protein [Janthinobacterium sp. SUN100]